MVFVLFDRGCDGEDGGWGGWWDVAVGEIGERVGGRRGKDVGGWEGSGNLIGLVYFGPLGLSVSTCSAGRTYHFFLHHLVILSSLSVTS